MSQLLHSVFSIFFPDQCRLCGETLSEFTRTPVCSPCLDGLTPLATSALCRVCGDPQPGAAGELCSVCAAGETSFERARSFGAYEGALREVLHLFKYRGMRPLAGPLAERLERIFRQEQWDGAQFQAIVAVPLARERLRQRGFNQSDLLARGLGRRLGLPVWDDTCRRARATAVQTGLTRAQRAENVRGAFVPGLAAGRIAGHDLLLVDDVLTTGATLNSCAKVLRQAGARRICALTVARTL